MDDEQRRTPTWSRVWKYPWLIRGIPGYRPFWRPIEGWSLVAGGVVFLLTLFLRRIGIRPTNMAPMIWFHFGIPVLAGYAVSRLQLNGKRLDRWVRDEVLYLFEPKHFDRFREVEQRTVYSFMAGSENKDEQERQRGPAAAAGRIRHR